MRNVSRFITRLGLILSFQLRKATVKIASSQTDYVWTVRRSPLLSHFLLLYRFAVTLFSNQLLSFINKNSSFSYIRLWWTNRCFLWATFLHDFFRLLFIAKQDVLFQLLVRETSSDIIHEPLYFIDSIIEKYFICVK